MDWLSIVILAAILAAFAAAVRYIRRHPGCSGSCGSCHKDCPNWRQEQNHE